jgi:hypothetical protein
LIGLAGVLLAVRHTPVAMRFASQDRDEARASVVAKARRRRRTAGWFGVSRAHSDE